MTSHSILILIDDLRPLAGSFIHLHLQSYAVDICNDYWCAGSGQTKKPGPELGLSEYEWDSKLNSGQVKAQAFGENWK